MRGLKKTRGHKSRGGTSARDHNIGDQRQESVGHDKSLGAGYGMAKGPSQQMAGAAKKASMPAKVRRAAGASYAGSKEGSKPRSHGYLG